MAEADSDSIEATVHAGEEVISNPYVGRWREVLKRLSEEDKR